MKKVKTLTQDLVLKILNSNDIVIVEEEGKVYLAEVICDFRIGGKVKFNFRQVSKRKYDEIGQFQDGMALVKFDNKYGFINEKGQEICEPKYDHIEKWGTELFCVLLNGYAGLINKAGKEVLPARFLAINSLDKGYTCWNRENGKQIYGLINEKGELVCEPKYDNIQYCGNGIYWTSLNGTVEYIDEFGYKVSGPRFDKIYDFYGCLAVVVTDNGYGVIDKDNNIIIMPRYKGIAPFVNKEGGYNGKKFYFPCGFIVLNKFGNFENIGFKGEFRTYINSYESVMNWIR